MKYVNVSTSQIFNPNHLKGRPHFSRCPSTELCAVSRPWYISLEAQSMMERCMRYWTVSMRTTESPNFWMSLSIRLTARPFAAALQETQHQGQTLSNHVTTTSQWFT